MVSRRSFSFQITDSLECVCDLPEQVGFQFERAEMQEQVGHLISAWRPGAGC